MSQKRRLAVVGWHSQLIPEWWQRDLAKLDIMTIWLAQTQHSTFPSLGSSPWFDFQKSISRCTYFQDMSGPLSVHQPTVRPLGPAVQRWAPSISPGRPFASFTQSFRAVQAAVAIFTGGVRIWELPETDVDHSSVHRYLNSFSAGHLFFLEG